MPTTLEYLNKCDRPAFVATLGHLFEHSPWVAEQGWLRRPFASAEALHAALCATMRAAPAEWQMSLISAHPGGTARTAGTPDR